MTALDARPLSSAEAIAALLNAGGNLDLAAERTGLTKAQLVDAVDENMPEFRRKIAAVTMIDVYAQQARLRKTFEASIGDLQPYEAVKTYLALQQQIATLTNDKHVEVNINDYTWGRLPRHLQQLLAEVETNQELAQEVERQARLASPTAGDVT
jgi:hypothetical protein